MTNPDPSPASLIAHNITPRDVEHAPQVVEIAPPPGVLATVADAWSIPEIRHLSARMTVSRTDDGAGVEVHGRLKASVVQSCVVTLEPVVSEIEEDFYRLFLPPERIVDQDELDEDGNIIIDLDEEEPEPLNGGKADLGHLVLEELSLALDPFPRAPGISLDDVLAATGQDEAPEHPFASLAAYKARNRSD